MYLSFELVNLRRLRVAHLLPERCVTSGILSISYPRQKLKAYLRLLPSTLLIVLADDYNVATWILTTINLLLPLSPQNRRHRLSRHINTLNRPL
jgi:hypothetical protein